MTRICSGNIGHNYVSKQNNRLPKLANIVGGATGHVAIASMWNDHYSHLLCKVPSLNLPMHIQYIYIYALKEVTDFYQTQSTSFYMCFMDASKAFHRVSHWTLFKKIIDGGSP